MVLDEHSGKFLVRISGEIQPEDVDASLGFFYLGLFHRLFFTLKYNCNIFFIYFIFKPGRKPQSLQYIF